MAFKASGRELWVGRGEQYGRLSEAVAAAQDGDTIYVRAGVYENDFSTITDSVRIVGVGGKAHLKNTTSAIDNGKGILVVHNADVEIANLEFSGARVAHDNGAGIRFEGGSLRVEDSFFHHNENGLLAANIGSARLTVVDSEFAHNGRGDGYTHGLYAGRIAELEVRDSYFHDSDGGMHIKSRAAESTIIGNRLIDGGEQTNYNIDLPEAGVAVVRGNILEQSATSANRTLLHYGGEASSYSGSLLVEDNTFISHVDNATGVRNQTPISVRIEDNTFHNVDHIAAGPNSQSGNTVFDGLSNVGVNPEPAPEPAPAPEPEPQPEPEPGSDSDSSDTSLLVRVSGDDYNGDPRFELYVDGRQIGAKSVTADHAEGEWQTFEFSGDFGADGPDEVAIRFANDAWGGSSSRDRNLYVDHIEVDGTRLDAGDAVYERSNGDTLAGREKMSWNGSLVFDTDGVELLGTAASPADDGMSG